MIVDRKEFQNSRARVKHGILLGAVLALVGLGSLIFGGSTVRDAELVGAVALLMSAGVLVMVARGARDRRPRMVLDPDGIWFRDWKIDRVPWTAIDSAYASGGRVRALATLRLRDPEDFLRGLPESERNALKSNPLFRSPELRIPNGAVDAPLNELLAAIRAGLQGPAAS